MWLKFKEWADIYGPIYRTQMLGDTFIIITDEKIAEDLLVKRAKIYSDRPQIRSLFDAKSTYGSMEYLPLMGHNQYWARQRKFTHSYLTSASNAHYYGIVNFETKRWLHRLANNPDNFAYFLEDMASKVMCQLTWDDPSLSEYMTKSAWGLLTQMSPAGPITNLITPLWELPFSINPWQQAERKRHDEQQRWWLERLHHVRSQMAAGLARSSFTRNYLASAEKGAFNISGDHEASSVIGMMALVGVFTVAGPLYYFLLSMVYHPEWQQKCQAEIDEQCDGAMPTIADSAKLPTVRACIKETMRWKPNVPTGVAHEVEDDDYYNGMFIPKGSRILPLDWWVFMCYSPFSPADHIFRGFLRNSTKYPDPDNFRPERWLEAGWPTFQAPLTQFPTIMGMTSFGWGQRACLGQTLTRDELLVACGGLLWGFNLVKKRGADGKLIDPPLNKSNSLLIVKPDPFEMAFEARSESRRNEIEKNWAAASAIDTAEREAFAAVAAGKTAIYI
jgi:cytochrome P450